MLLINWEGTFGERERERERDSLKYQHGGGPAVSEETTHTHTPATEAVSGQGLVDTNQSAF